MDPRVSTAPTPTNRNQVLPNTGASCLLHRPTDDSQSHTSFLVARPLTCPTSTLSPQFHWNLNTSALTTLPRNQIKQLYDLFKFYDSSNHGDDLSSINCARLVEILRDARLLNESLSDFVGPLSHSDHRSGSKRVQVNDVEKVFAQAVMGKMRVYLDADGQPALTFPLFCGALMNCAMLLSPLAHPEAALRQFFPILLEGSSSTGHHSSATKGLLRHVPIHGSSSLWSPGQSRGTDPLAYHKSDFRQLPSFQQVIADCTRDKLLDEIKHEKLARHYQIPNHLIASFRPETLALIANKFRTFDVFDRGNLPRQEAFALLSSLGPHIDLPNPYAVLTTLSASNTESSVNTEGDITLTQLLQAVVATRESKRYTTNAQFAAMKFIHSSVHADPTPIVGDDTLSTQAMSSLQEADTANNNECCPAVASLQTVDRSLSSSLSKERDKKTGVTRAGNSSHSLLHNKHHRRSKVTLTRHASDSDKKKTGDHRKPSSNTKLDEVAEPSHCYDHGVSRQSSIKTNPSRRSDATFSSNESNAKVLDRPSSRKELHSERFSQCSVIIRRLAGFGHEAQAQRMSDSSTHQLDKLSTATAKCRKLIPIFLLLGDDQDGATCCTISLVLATKEITEMDGIYYSATPGVVTQVTPVLPTQRSLLNALLMLKTCVRTKQEQGYQVWPTNQLNVVDGMLRDLKKKTKKTRVKIAQSSVTKVLQKTTTSALPGPARADFKSPIIPSKAQDQLAITQHCMKNGLRTCVSSPGLIQVSTSPSRRPLKVLPRLKPVHQIKLPSNYKELLTVWDMVQNDAWIHDVNAASPLKPVARCQSPSKVAISAPFSSKLGDELGLIKE